MLLNLSTRSHVECYSFMNPPSRKRWRAPDISAHDRDHGSG